MRRSTALPRLIVILLALSATAVLAVLAVLLATEKRVAAAAPDYRVVTSGRHRVRVDARTPDRSEERGRQADRRGPVSRRPHATRGERSCSARSSRSPTTRPTRCGRRIGSSSATTHGRVYHPISLPASNAYAYRARVVRPGTRLPGVGSPADDNLAATGLMLLFRIPAFDYDDGSSSWSSTTRPPGSHRVPRRSEGPRPAPRAARPHAATGRRPGRRTGRLAIRRAIGVTGADTASRAAGSGQPGPGRTSPAS